MSNLSGESMVMALTSLEDLFAHYYVETPNATRAYTRAGGKAKRPDVAASLLLSQPRVRARVTELRARRLAAIEFSAREILLRLVDHVRADLADIFDENFALRPVDEWPIAWRTGLIVGFEVREEFRRNGNGNKVVTGQIKRVKLADRTKILEQVGRHADVNAWRQSRDEHYSETLRLMIDSWAEDNWLSIRQAEMASSNSDIR